MQPAAEAPKYLEQRLQGAKTAEEMLKALENVRAAPITGFYLGRKFEYAPPAAAGEASKGYGKVDMNTILEHVLRVQEQDPNSEKVKELRERVKKLNDDANTAVSSAAYGKNLLAKLLAWIGRFPNIFKFGLLNKHDILDSFECKKEVQDAFKAALGPLVAVKARGGESDAKGAGAGGAGVVVVGAAAAAAAAPAPRAAWDEKSAAAEQPFMERVASALRQASQAYREHRRDGGQPNTGEKVPPEFIKELMLLIPYKKFWEDNAEEFAKALQNWDPKDARKPADPKTEEVLRTFDPRGDKDITKFSSDQVSMAIAAGDEKKLSDLVKQIFSKVLLESRDRGNFNFRLYRDVPRLGRELQILSNLIDQNANSSMNKVLIKALHEYMPFKSFWDENRRNDLAMAIAKLKLLPGTDDVQFGKFQNNEFAQMLSEFGSVRDLGIESAESIVAVSEDPKQLRLWADYFNSVSMMDPTIQGRRAECLKKAAALEQAQGEPAAKAAS